MDTKIVQKRINNLLRVHVIVFFILVLKLVHLQIICGKHFYRLSEENRTYVLIESAPRGTIYDYMGNVVATNKPVPAAFFYPFSNNVSLSEEFVNNIESILPGSKYKLYSGMKSKKIVCLSDNITRRQMFSLLEQKANLPAIATIFFPRRYYPYGKIASHVIGYVGEADTRELQNGYKRGDLIGKTGLEAAYDAFLRGKDGGWLVETDVKGQQIKMLRHIMPEKGNNLHLTLDISLQKIAEEALQNTGLSGAIVGIDPRSGAVRIMVSQPGFDPNIFTAPESTKKLEIVKDTSLPLFNRALQAEYLPGSVFKIITSIAALTEKKITVMSKFYCPGYFKLGTKVFGCWEEKGHGEVSFFPGIIHSCDVYFYQVGLKVGIELLKKYAYKFGLGRKTGIDLKFEKNGFIGDPSWKRNKIKIPWVEGDTVNVAIGQGYINVTILQLANMIACIANRGTLWKPYLVDKITTIDEEIIYKARPTKLAEVDLPEEVWEVLQEGLKRVVSEGTGLQANLTEVVIAGKTGTAENPHGEDHGLFVAYAPFDNPEIAIAILVEHGGKGGAIAAPIARKIFSGMTFTETQIAATN